MTEPGQTDNYSLSDHIKAIEKYIDKIDIVIANNSKLPKNMELLAKSEGKDQVIIDEDKLNELGIHVIQDKLFKIEDGYIRHNSLKTAYHIFSYLIEGE